MDDWAGNKIRVGDTVVFYKFKKTVLVTECMTSSEASYENERKKTKEEYIWQFEKEFLIANDGGYSTFAPTSMDNCISLSHLPYLMPKGDYYAMCVRGISDNRIDFMTDYFTL